MDNVIQFPPQQIPLSKKTKKWRKDCVDWAEKRNYLEGSLVRNTIIKKRICYDLLNGKLHMDDLRTIFNPDNIDAGYISDKIQHYPIINSKLEVLKGEEYKRLFDFKVVVTNPTAVSEIEETKKQKMFSEIQQLVQNESIDEETLNQNIEKISHYFKYEYQDFREMRANMLLNHYWKEYNLPKVFNDGFSDAYAVGEEIYRVDIIGGEPVIKRLNPEKVFVYKSGFSNKIEDADIIVVVDYMNIGKIYDEFYDVLSTTDLKKIEDIHNEDGGGLTEDPGNVDERYGIISDCLLGLGDENRELFLEKENDFSGLMPYDNYGNIRVLRVYWKSRRKVKKVKRYNKITGDIEYKFFPEDYVLNKDEGEEEETYFINQAWEGTKIGSDVYVNMRPRPVQYNRISNPSECHFGIIGSIYNLNDDRPFSMVDMMKPFNYLYDVIHDRLNKLISHNWGKLVKLDLALVPDGWEVDKWMDYAKKMNLAVINSYNEGNKGAATGKLAGTLNNNSNGVIDADFGNNIQQYINLLEYIKNEMSEVVGITKQREGQISNRETVGGVERATVQSSHITEWIYIIHDDLKKRVLECFLETAKIAMKGETKKFNYILPDNSKILVDIDGDEFAECDYGLVVDNSASMNELKQKLDTLAQAALQNSLLKFSSIMQLYSTSSMSEKMKMIEKAEQDMQQQQQQQQQQAMQQQQEQIQMQMQQKQAEMDAQMQMNNQNNETKIRVAEIQAGSSLASAQMSRMNNDNQSDNDKLAESKRQFDEKLKFDNKKLETEKKLREKEIRNRAQK